MPFRSGQRVSITRTSSANQRYGDTGTVISTGWDTSSRQTYNVRIDREFSRSATQRARGYDFTMRSSQLARSTAAAPEPERNPTVAVGDRVTAVQVTNVSAAAGQSGTVVDVYENFIGVRFDRSISGDHGGSADTWNVRVWTREVPAATPAPVTFTVGQRVRLRDGARTLASIAVTDPAGTEGEIVEFYPGSTSLSVRTARHTWSVQRDHIEAVSSTPATEWVAATAENVAVGARIRYVNPLAGDVVHVNDEGVLARVSGTSVFIRMDSPREGKSLVGAGETAYHWSAQLSDIEVSVPVSAATAWVDATEANAVEGARIRYRRTVGNVVTENDEGVIVVHGVVGATSRRIRMDTPRPSAGALSGTGDGAFNFTVLLSDIQVQVPATTSTAPAETAPSTPAVTFTPEQAALIKRVAERYTRDHGFNALAADVFAALGINDAPASKKLRFTVEYEVDVLPAVDGAELPGSASAAIVDAAARAASITGLLSESVRPVDGTIEAAVSRIRYID